MNIGCCEKCRYLDLIETTGGKCPRCLGSMVSLNIDTVKWNRLSIIDKEETINRVVPRIPVSEVFMELVRDEEPKEQPVVFPKPKIRQVSTREDILKQDTVPIPVIGHIPGPGEEDEPKANIKPEPEAEQKPQPDLVQGPDVKFDMVYACYKCNSIAGHDGVLDRYYCSECGSAMVDIGITTREWADLSKEDKRRVTEEARIRHMVTAIKKASYDESDEEHMQNIINVVGKMAQ